MTRKRRAQQIKYMVDWQRRFHTHRCTHRGDLKFLYARMYARKPDVIYTNHWQSAGVSHQLLHAA